MATVRWRSRPDCWLASMATVTTMTDSVATTPMTIMAMTSVTPLSACPV
jgi:hypothetical protein